MQNKSSLNEYNIFFVEEDYDCVVTVKKNKNYIKIKNISFGGKLDEIQLLSEIFQKIITYSKNISDCTEIYWKSHTKDYLNKLYTNIIIENNGTMAVNEGVINYQISENQNKKAVND